MPNSGPTYGTMIIAGLLLLALAFAATWILYYVEPGRDPRTLFPWFGAAAALIIALGFVVYLARSRSGR